MIMTNSSKEMEDRINKLSDTPYEYKMGKKMGDGQNSVAYHCSKYGSDSKYVCQCILKAGEQAAKEKSHKHVRKEIARVYKLVGCHTVLHIKEVYEDAYHIYIVMEIQKDFMMEMFINPIMGIKSF